MACNIYFVVEFETCFLFWGAEALQGRTLMVWSFVVSWSLAEGLKEQSPLALSHIHCASFRKRFSLSVTALCSSDLILPLQASIKSQTLRVQNQAHHDEYYNFWMISIKANSYSLQ